MRGAKRRSDRVAWRILATGCNVPCPHRPYILIQANFIASTDAPPPAWVFLDVDGTLRHHPDGVDQKAVLAAQPRPGLHPFMERLHALGVGIVVWSAGGKVWAEEAVDRLKIHPWVTAVYDKQPEVPLEYKGPCFFVDDWPQWLDSVIEPHHPRCIVYSWDQSDAGAELDEELERAADEVAAWLRGIQDESTPRAT